MEAEDDHVCMLHILLKGMFDNGLVKRHADDNGHRKVIGPEIFP
jgi:hypothetical protein